MIILEETKQAIQEVFGKTYDNDTILKLCPEVEAHCKEHIIKCGIPSEAVTAAPIDAIAICDCFCECGYDEFCF